jgi:hypothetical protein
VFYQSTFALAEMGDEEVLDWAERNLTSTGERQGFAVHTVAISPSVRADRFARDLIRAGDSSGLIHLVQGYQDADKNENRWDRLRDVVELEPKGPELSRWLRLVLERLASAGESRAGDLVKLLPPPVEDEEND